MMTSFSTCILILGVVFLAGCGTIRHGTTQQLTISSNPAGAIVVVDGVERAQTPVSLELSRKDRHTVSVSMFGYENYQTVVGRKWATWSLLGGPVGLLIDNATGGLYKFESNQIDVFMTPDTTQVVVP